MTKDQRRLIQHGVMFLAGPIIFLAVVVGFLWQFADFGWTVGGVAFNRFFDPRPRGEDHV